MDKYSTIAEKLDYDVTPELDDKGDPITFQKLVITNEAFAVAEMLHELSLQIKFLRDALNK